MLLIAIASIQQTLPYDAAIYLGVMGKNSPGKLKFINSETFFLRKIITAAEQRASLIVLLKYENVSCKELIRRVSFVNFFENFPNIIQVLNIIYPEWMRN